MKKQRGMVLILAMLIVVLVISITVSLSWRYNLSLTRSENRLHGMQARAYLEGTETYAGVILQEDARLDQQNNRAVDSLDEDWAMEIPPVPTDVGWVQGRIEDAQGRFNINLLQEVVPQLQGNNPPSNLQLHEKFTASQARFIRLLQTFEFEDGAIDQAQAVEITEAVIDWIDIRPGVTGFGGAETAYYQQLDPPTTPPNDLMVSVSELIRIKGMTPELYRALLPYVIALPESAKLNINTMPLVLMRTMAGIKDFSPLTEVDAQLLLEERTAQGGNAQLPNGANGMNQPNGANQPGGANQPAQATGGFPTVAAFKSSQVLAALVNATGGFDTTDLAVESNYFLLYSEARVGDQISDGASLLEQGNAGVTVIRRTDAHF